MSIILKSYKNRDVLKVFNKGFFWDIKLDRLNFKKDAVFIIERVLRYGIVEKELPQLEKIYKKEYIKSIVQDLDIFGNETVIFLANHYNLEASKFRRYIPNI